MTQVNSFNWKEFLSQWSKDLLNSDLYPEELPDNFVEEEPKTPPELITSRWLGYSGATEEQIKQAEKRLGVTLPNSYRDFLKVSNGWRRTTDYIYRVWSIEDIDWFSVKHQDWINAYYDPNDSIPIANEEYFIYGSEQSAIDFRSEYLQTALEVSKEGKAAIYLLNPQVVTLDGEWEAWLFANWLAGAYRFRSFGELMQVEHKRFVNWLEHQKTLL